MPNDLSHKPFIIPDMNDENNTMNSGSASDRPCSLLEHLHVSSVCLLSLWMPVRRQTYQCGALYLLKEDQWGSHRHAQGLIFYWLAPLRLIFYWLAPPSSLSLLAGSFWGQPVSCAGLRWSLRGALPAWLGLTQIALSPVWEKHATLFPPSGQRDSHYCFSSNPFLPSSSSVIVLTSHQFYVSQFFIKR